MPVRVGRPRPSPAGRAWSCVYVWRQTKPSLWISTSIRVDSALTTETPTPCRPPETAYALPSNLPPACSMVSATSTPGFFSFGCMSTGMPRPLSMTRTPPSASSDDVDRVAVAGQRLVDRVVHDLPDQVVQAALAGRADVHAGPLADRLEALQDGDRRGAVVLLASALPPSVTFSRQPRRSDARRGLGGRTRRDARTVPEPPDAVERAGRRGCPRSRSADTDVGSTGTRRHPRAAGLRSSLRRESYRRDAQHRHSARLGGA